MPKVKVRECPWTKLTFRSDEMYKKHLAKVRERIHLKSAVKKSEQECNSAIAEIKNTVDNFEDLAQAIKSNWEPIFRHCYLKKYYEKYTGNCGCVFITFSVISYDSLHDERFDIAGDLFRFDILGEYHFSPPPKISRFDARQVLGKLGFIIVAGNSSYDRITKKEKFRYSGLLPVKSWPGFEKRVLADKLADRRTENY